MSRMPAERVAESPKHSLKTSEGRKQAPERAFKAICLLALVLPLLLLAVLIAQAFADGWERLTWDFLTSYPSRFPAQAGILPALVGSACLMLLTAAMAIPIGVGAAIYLEEYARPSWWTSFISR